jgi:foldase protein PrsA
MENEEVVAKKGGDVRISKKVILIIGIIILVAMLGYQFRGIFVAATVNGSPITRIEVIRALEKSGGKQALEGLVTQKVLADEIKRQGIIITDTEMATEMKRISDQVAAQGGTLDAALAAQGMTLADLTKQVTTQLQVEKMIAEKIKVTDAEVSAYITTNKLNIPADKVELARTQIMDQLKHEKVTKEGQAFVDGLRTAAHVSVFTHY